MLAISCIVLFACHKQSDQQILQQPKSPAVAQHQISITGLKVINPNLTTDLTLPNTQTPAELELVGGSDGVIIYRKHNSVNWQAADTNGITDAIARFCSDTNGKQLVAVGEQGLLAVSTDTGQRWQKLPTSATTENLFDCAYNQGQGNWLITSESGSVYYGDDINGVFKKAQAPGALTHFYPIIARQLLLAAGPELVASSNDGGETWTRLLALPGAAVTALLDTGTQLLVTTDQGKLWRTHDLLHWAEVEVQQGSSIMAVAQDGSHKTLSLITSQGDVFISDDDGNSWGISFSAGKPLVQLLYDATQQTFVAIGSSGIFYSDNGGRVWQKAAADVSDELHFLWRSSQQLLAFGSGGALASSIDGGKNWQLQRPALTSFIHQLKPAPDNSLLLSGANGLLLRSDDGGDSWQKIQANLSTQDFLFSLLTTGDATFAAGSPGSILRSADSGKTWQNQLSLGDPNKGYFHKIIGDSQRTLVAIAGPGSSYVSTDKGDTWQPIASNHNQHLFNGIYDEPHHQFIVVGNGGIIQTSGDGVEWKIAQTNTEADLQGIASVEGKLYASGSQGLLLRSIDAGKSWQLLNTKTNTAIQHIAAVGDGSILLATGLNGLLLRSTDQGDNWQPIALPEVGNLREPIVDSATNIIYISSRSGNILFSKDAGKTWDKLPQVTQESIKGIYIDDARRTLVGYGARLIRVPLLER